MASPNHHSGHTFVHTIFLTSQLVSLPFTVNKLFDHPEGHEAYTDYFQNVKNKNSNRLQEIIFCKAFSLYVVSLVIQLYIE